MSDHGHYFGDHGLQGKPWGDLGQLYEPMTQIPLMMDRPGGGAGRCPHGDKQWPTIACVLHGAITYIVTYYSSGGFGVLSEKGSSCHWNNNFYACR